MLEKSLFKAHPLKSVNIITSSLAQESLSSTRILKEHQLCIIISKKNPCLKEHPQTSANIIISKKKRSKHYQILWIQRKAFKAFEQEELFMIICGKGRHPLDYGRVKWKYPVKLVYVSQWDNDKSTKVEEEQQQLQQQCLSKLLPHKSLSKCLEKIS